MTQTKISKAYQTRLCAEAIRALGLRPGQRLNQIVEGNRLILEPVADVEALAGSLGKRSRAHSLGTIKAAARRGIAQAGAAGLRKLAEGILPAAPPALSSSEGEREEPSPLIWYLILSQIPKGSEVTT